MAHGENSLPLEEIKARPVQVDQTADTSPALLVIDVELRESLLAMEKHLETIATLLAMVCGGGDIPRRS